MHKSLKLAALAGALSMVMGGSAMSANLIFDGWTVAGGTIDAKGTSGSICATNSGYDCSTVASGSGFTQVQVTPNTAGSVVGESYIMTIVTDQNADGQPGNGSLGFYDVSFVKMKLSLGGNGDNNENGIAAQQKISEVTLSTGGGTATSFDSTTDINTGWSTAATPVSITQTLVDNGDALTAGDNFDSKFNYQSSNDVDGLRDGFAMSIDQVAGLASAADSNSFDDVQVFALRERQGALLATANNTGVNLGGGNVNWGAGEDIKAIWLGQTINLGGNTPQAGSLGSQFGYLSFENVSGGTGPITEFGFAATNANSAWVWDPAFNIGSGSGTPTICDPSGVSTAPCP